MEWSGSGDTAKAAVSGYHFPNFDHAMKTLDVLEDIPLFAGLQSHDLAQLHELAFFQTLLPNTHLLQKGHHGGSIYVLLSGSVRVTLPGFSGREASLTMLGSGEVMGELSALDGKGHSAHVVAVEKTQVLGWKCEDFRNCWKTMPALTQNLSYILVHRMRRLTDQWAARMSLNVRGRIAHQLLIFAEDYGLTKADGTTGISLCLTQSDLASLVGATREKVSRDLKYFRDRKYISIENRCYYHIHDRQALERHCS